MSAAEESKNKIVPSIFPIICMVLLLVALCKLPYGYYTLLRLSIFIWGIIYGIKHYSISKNCFLTTLSFGVAVLYNPIIVVHLERPQWAIINIITIFIIYLCSIEIKGYKRTDEAETYEKEVAIKPQEVGNQAWKNISRIVHTCLNIKVNNKEIFETSHEKIEALYYVMFLVKKDLELNHNVSKTEPCLLHLAAILSELDVQQQDIVTLIKIWAQNRLATYDRCNITEWARTLGLLCTWARHNGHTAATINNEPRIVHNYDENNIELSIRLEEIAAWVNELQNANIHGIIAKDMLTYAVYSNM